MDHLPQEILGDILLRLPSSSLMRVSCVSKNLNAFIYGSYFVNLHLKYTQNRRILVVKGNQKRWWNYEDYNTRKRLSIFPFNQFDVDASGNRFLPADLPLPFPADFYVKLYGSCNGIVCISHLSRFYLCNPYTRRFLALPDPSFTSHHATTCGIGIWFDTARKDYFVIRLVLFFRKHDLGLDTSSIYHNFEVSNFLCHNQSAEELHSGQGSSSSSSSFSSGGTLGQGWPTLGAEIYDVNINSWRKLDVVLPHIEEKNCVAILAGRYFHWCTKGLKILAFDSSHQKFRQITIPGDVPLVVPAWNVGVLDDTLAFVFLFEHRIEAWVLKGYRSAEESWMRRYSIIIHVQHIGLPSLSCWNDGRVFMANDIEPELISCHLEGDGSTEGYVMGYGNIFRTSTLYSLSYVVYEESLVSLDRGHEGMPWRSIYVRRY